MATVTLGLKVRTGKAAVVALRGPATEPQVVDKAMIQVAFTFEEGAVFHAVEQMPIAKARAHVERAEARFTKLAHEELAAFVKQLGEDVSDARLSAPPAKQLAAIGKASGRPWAAEQKEAALAAWTALINRN
jgi:hypothetical protein